MTESQRERLERCQREVDEHPEQASAHFNLGLAYTVSGRVKQAEASYHRALELDPTLIQAWVNLGGVRLLRWDFKGCLEANQQALRIDPGSVRANFNAGQAYLYLNDPENLLAAMKRVLELERDHAEAHYYAAVGELALDNLGAAERHLERATELGHRPTQEFLRALEGARLRASRESKATLIEISGAEAPDNPKEE